MKWQQCLQQEIGSNLLCHALALDVHNLPSY
jgi:hypothetical protein